MRLTHLKFSAPQIGLILLAAAVLVFVLKPGSVRAQRTPPTVAQVGPGAPLPVYVVNDVPPSLPEGFTVGTSWKFTTWTLPSTLTFTATVQKVEGGWALLALGTDSGSARWYYIPQMPGAWEAQ